MNRPGGATGPLGGSGHARMLQPDGRPAEAGDPEGAHGHQPPGPHLRIHPGIDGAGPLRISFYTLFEERETRAMRHASRAGGLDGRRVEMHGVLTTTHGDEPAVLLTDRPGVCPDCWPVPLAVVLLAGLRVLPPGIVAGETPVVVRGRLCFGYDHAAFLRIEDATVEKRRTQPER